MVALLKDSEQNTGNLYISGSQPGVILPPAPHLTTAGDAFVYHNLGVGRAVRRVRLNLVGRNRMPPNILQCTGQASTIKNYPAHKVGPCQG